MKNTQHTPKFCYAEISGTPMPPEQTGAYYVACDCLRAFVLTLYHAKRRGMDNVGHLICHHKIERNGKTAIFR